MPNINIAIINLMPSAQDYIPVMQKAFEGAELTWIRMVTHPYRSSDHHLLNQTHCVFSTVDWSKIDGVFLSGAPVDRMTFSEVHYWDELTSYLDIIHALKIPIIAVCWGAAAVGKHFFKIPSNIFSEKLFGVYPMQILDEAMRAESEAQTYDLPQSRFCGMDNDCLEHLAKEGRIRLADYHEDVGYSTVISADNLLWMVQGHPEYPLLRLKEEFERDQRNQSKLPYNYSVESPNHTWQITAQIIFGNFKKSMGCEYG